MNIQPYGVSTEKVDEMCFSKDEAEILRLSSGDVLISEGGDVGRSAVWEGLIAICGFQNAINRARPKPNSNPNYFFLLDGRSKSF
jgi:type I restriction enzyme S subunit